MKKVIFLLCLIGLTGCIDFRTLERWQSKRSIAKYDKAEKAYYDKETPAQKALREKNRLFCRKIATDIYPPIVNAGYEINSKRTDKRWAIEEKCMEERGSPVF